MRSIEHMQGRRHWGAVILLGCAVGAVQAQGETPPAEVQATESQAVEAVATEPQVPEPQPIEEQAVESTPDEGFFAGLFGSDFDISFGGFIRPEFAISTGSENPNNQRGNVFNKRTIQRTAYAPPALLGNITGGLGLPLPDIGTWNTLPLTVLGFQDEVRRPVPESGNTFNMHYVRAETEVAVKFNSNWSIIGRIRGLFDPGHYSQFDAASVADLQGGGIAGGDPALYQGAPNYFQYRVEGDKSPNPLEWSGDDYMVYFPALLLDYTNGPLNVRIGNQQIAWGQAIFFRVLDVPDGIDYRRHFILDRAVEEYGDKRVPSLAIRATFQATDNILADAYVQKFQPTIYPNPNTPYNIIPTQFTIHDMYAAGKYDNEISYGLRLKGDYGQWGFQAVAARRFNPDGVFRWTESGVNRDLPNSGLGGLVNASYAVSGQYGSTGEALAHTPFEVAPGGVYSANEWFYYAADARLAGTDGLNSAVLEFPAVQDLYASVAGNYEEATHELNTFFMAAGGSLRGHLAREYFQETNLGGGISYVNEGEPGSFFDQLIFNLEAMYVPDRRFTNPSLSRNYLKERELTVALVMDKWHRFFNEFPGTYIVFQGMHKTKSDLVGRSLKGYGGSEQEQSPGQSGGSNYLVMAFLQPFPNQIYQVEFATLVDLKGGALLQPGLRWKPSGDVTVEGFYTYINGDLGGNPNDNVVSSLGFADEFTLRLTYQF
ncbi:hypothetical protein D0B54_18410 [Solimonas sp. K1W22B-7]|uniref:DUF1302 family protein n=1 Tax=Solimonas sp. K1W22B-7 TaxID=2303331 RepID=UPI000E32DF1D|nr:DUF1302 family protein [Solimonas sp. K1W22B-7]AXQ30533.1 hypothetical protein D0B54_18410 [Solimonas sp. K1W22B-7]